MIKKLFIGTILAIVAFVALYLYFMYAGEVNTLRDWIQNYKIYTAIFFFSIIAIYMLQGENKLLQLGLFIVVFINLYILGAVFFKNNIGLNNGQFITICVLILIGLGITYITHRVRYILGTIVIVASIFVLLTGTIPLYENMPNTGDFIQTQTSKIINKGISNEGILRIKNSLGSKDIAVKDLKETDIDLSQKTQILFISKNKKDGENIFIDVGNGSLIHITPQSAITLEQTGNQTIMQIIQGNIEYYTPSQFSGVLQVIGKYKGKNIEEIKQGARKSLTNQFESKKEEFFVNQIGGSIVLNPVVNKTIGFFINTLYIISPSTYQKNLNNYNNIQKLFGKEPTKEISSTTTGEGIQSIIKDLMGQVKKGAEETSISGRLK